MLRSLFDFPAHSYHRRHTMKIVVYAICKNEAQFISRWIKSMS